MFIFESKTADWSFYFFVVEVRSGSLKTSTSTTEGPSFGKTLEHVYPFTQKKKDKQQTLALMFHKL